jgi:4-amino-4-deoxy-L-arabinose transferase-like glycosyltransferase
VNLEKPPFSHNGLILLGFILLFPAIFHNLDLFPLIADEPIRGLVSLEMVQNKNFLLPSLIGEPYLNKPPLYNWWLVGLSKITGDINPLTIRLGAVIPLIFFVILIVLGLRRFMGNHLAALAGLSFVTSSRILFYDLTLGHIDFLFSGFVFASFLAVAYWGVKGKWWILYPVIYALLVLQYFLKGLPGPVFLGCALLALCIFRKEIRFLFHPAHFLSILIFMGILGFYYYQYNQQQPILPLVQRLWEESSKRTALDKNIWDTVIHLFVFPLEYFVHLFPWSLFGLFLFSGVIRRKIWRDPNLRILGLILLCNLPVYWLSPDTRPRYIFCLFPLVLAIIFMAAENGLHFSTYFRKMLENIMLAYGLALAIPQMILLSFPNYYPDFWLQMLLSGLAGCIVFLAKKFEKDLHYYMVLLLLVSRITFDSVVLPYRVDHSPEPGFRADAQAIANLAGKEDLYLPSDQWIKEVHAYYITWFRGKPIERGLDFKDKNGFLLAYKNDPRVAGHQPLFEFKINDLDYVLVKLKAFHISKKSPGENSQGSE